MTSGILSVNGTDVVLHLLGRPDLTPLELGKYEFSNLD
jgi:hypothetical protein